MYLKKILNTSSFFHLLIWVPILLIPVLHTNFTIDANIHIRFVALSLYLLVLCVFAFFLFKQKDSFLLPNDTVFILFILYGATSLPGCIISPFSLGDSLFELVKIILLPAFVFLLVAVFRQQPNFIQELSKCVTLLASLLILYAICQLALLTSFTRINHHALYEIKTTFAHKNIFSEIIFMMLPFSLYCFYSCKNLWRWIGIGCAFLLLVFIVILMTRAVWIAFAGSVLSFSLLYLFCSVRKGTLHIRKRTIFTMAMFAAVILLSIAIYAHYDHENTFVKQVKSIFNFTYGSTKERIILWKNSLKIFLEHPWWGAGMGNWQIEILKYGNKDLVSEDAVTFYQRPHNDFIWILTEQGIFAFLLYLSILTTVYYNIVKIIMHSPDRLERIFFYLAFFGFTGYCIFSLFSFPKERAEHLLLLSFSISSVLIYKQRLFSTPRNSIRKKYSFPILLFVLLAGVFALTVSAVRLDSEKHLARAFDARQAADWNTMIRELDLAESTFYHIDQVSTPLRWYRGLANFNLNNMQNALYDFKQAYSYNPYHVHVLNNLGTCYEMAGNHSVAIEYYEKAMELSPSFEEARFNLCASYFNSGNGKKAYEELRQIKPDTASEKYNHFLDFVLPLDVKTMRDTADAKTKDRMDGVLNTKGWMNQIHFKSIENKNSLEKQLILDLIYVSETMKKDTAEANSLKHKYEFILK